MDFIGELDAVEGRERDEGGFGCLPCLGRWPGGCGCPPWQARHHRRGREGRGKKRLTRGPRESVGEKGEKGAAWSRQAAAA